MENSTTVCSVDLLPLHHFPATGTGRRCRGGQCALPSVLRKYSTLTPVRDDLAPLLRWFRALQGGVVVRSCYEWKRFLKERCFLVAIPVLSCRHFLLWVDGQVTIFWCFFWFVFSLWPEFPVVWWELASAVHDVWCSRCKRSFRFSFYFFRLTTLIDCPTFVGQVCMINFL